LGNPGEDYQKTRHNAGFLAVDHFASHFQLGPWLDKTDLNSELIETRLGGQKLIVAKPTTYMNKSGLAVVKLQNYFGVNDPDILIIHDDVDIDFGVIRTRIGGSNAGHNGLKSIEQVIGDGFARIRIGVRNDHLEHTDTSEFVLKNFSRAEQNDLPLILKSVSQFAYDFVADVFKETSLTLQ
jgi:PTH1 family peptidyl-tRNA hydrolase